MGDEPTGAATLTLRYAVSPGRVEIEGTGSPPARRSRLSDLSSNIVGAVVDEYEVEDDDGVAPLPSREAKSDVTDEEYCEPTGTDEDLILEQFREYRRTQDRTTRNRLVEAHLSLARTLARRFANRNEPLDDLEQVAMLGVLKAVERFDPERGIPFAAFAVPTVVGELRRHFRDRGWMVRVPRRLQDLHLRIGPVVSELSQQLGRSPTIREIADAADVREEDVLEALDAGNRYRPAPLDVTGGPRPHRQRARIGRRPRDAPRSPARSAGASAARHVHALLRGHDAGRDRRCDRRLPDARVEDPDAQPRDAQPRPAAGPVSPARLTASRPRVNVLPGPGIS